MGLTLIARKPISKPFTFINELGKEVTITEDQYKELDEPTNDDQDLDYLMNPQRHKKITKLYHNIENYYDIQDGGDYNLSYSTFDRYRTIFLRSVNLSAYYKDNQGHYHELTSFLPADDPYFNSLEYKSQHHGYFDRHNYGWKWKQPAGFDKAERQLIKVIIHHSDCDGKLTVDEVHQWAKILKHQSLSSTVKNYLDEQEPYYYAFVQFIIKSAENHCELLFY